MIKVKKASGGMEDFSEQKVKSSLKRAGADKDLADLILTHIKSELYDGISTQKIYSHIYDLLKRERSRLAPRYSLKHAVMQLGPTGYPFEKFIASILKEEGYKTEVGVVVSGKCVNHEVDVVAQKDKQHFMVECKFHNRPGTRSDVKVALYVKARFDDVAETWKQKPGHKTMFHQAWLVTNTKLTSDAIAFGECVGMKLIAWNYPQEGSLQNLIEETGLHPLTCLTTLSKQQRRRLLEQDIVLCRDIVDAKPGLFASVDISREKEEQIRKEAMLICETKQMENGLPVHEM